MLAEKNTEENQTRLENVHELKSSIVSYVENAEEPTLAGFLEEIALYTDIEQYDPTADAAVMMTMHSAKGLEFPGVSGWLGGGLFPGMRAIGEPEEMEEERRLCYVAITRARERLTISYAHQRMLYGRTNACMPSRFLKEIPEECVEHRGGYHPKPAPPGDPWRTHLVLFLFQSRLPDQPGGGAEKSSYETGGVFRFCGKGRCVSFHRLSPGGTWWSTPPLVRVWCFL